jgi:hypothetical protein
MISTSRIVLALTLATGLGAVCLAPVRAQTTAEALTASAAPTLDLSSRPDVAMNAAKAAQAAKIAPPSAGVTVEPVTVTPETPVKGKVVASTDAASLTSPNFSAKDIGERTLAVSVGHNTAVGAQSVENTHMGGFLAVNPQGDTTRTDVGFARVF